MDEVDLQILKELTKDPQTPFLRIAEKIGVSPKTAQTRYNKMKEKGVILRSSIIIDLSKLGYQGKAFLKIANTPNRKRNKTIDALKQMQNVILFTEIMGDFDMLAIVAVKDFKSIVDSVNAIRKLPSVDLVEVSLSDDTSFPVGKGFNQLFLTKKEEPDA